MTWPMILLAVGSVGSGALLAIGGTLEHWLEPVVGAHESRARDTGVGGHRDHRWPWWPSASRSPYAHVRHPAGARETRLPVRR